MNGRGPKDGITLIFLDPKKRTRTDEDNAKGMYFLPLDLIKDVAYIHPDSYGGNYGLPFFLAGTLDPEMVTKTAYFDDDGSYFVWRDDDKFDHYTPEGVLDTDGPYEIDPSSLDEGLAQIPSYGTSQARLDCINELEELGYPIDDTSGAYKGGFVIIRRAGKDESPLVLTSLSPMAASLVGTASTPSMPWELFEELVIMISETNPRPYAEKRLRCCTLDEFNFGGPYKKEDKE